MVRNNVSHSNLWIFRKMCLSREQTKRAVEENVKVYVSVVPGSYSDYSLEYGMKTSCFPQPRCGKNIYT